MSLLSMMTGQSMNDSSGTVSTDHTPSSSVPPSPSLGLQHSESFAETPPLEEQRSPSSFVDSRRVRNRVPLEGHLLVRPSEGGIIVFNGCQPPEWEDLPSAAALHEFQRDVVFPGEQIQVLIYLRPLDPSLPIDPFAYSLPPPGQKWDGSGPVPPPPLAQANSNRVNLGLGDLQPSISLKKKAPALVSGPRGDTSRREGHGRCSQLLFESAQRSHFVVQMTDPQAAHSVSKIRASVFGGSRSKLSGSVSSSMERAAGAEGGGLWDRQTSDAHGCTPLLMEDGVFDPLTGGGLARRVAAVCSLESGDVAVLLEVSLATSVLSETAVLQVLQFERMDPGPEGNIYSEPTSPQFNGIPPSDSSRPPEAALPPNPVRSLRQWLLPLDRPFASDNSPSPASSSSSTPWTPSPPTFTFSSVSLSLPRFPTSPLFSSALPPPTPRVGLEEGGEEESRFVGSEGLLSFRGSDLEPQRFGVQCGLKGAYVPGRRWTHPLPLLQPLKIESYCTPDLICLLVQNCLPQAAAYRHLVVYIDAVSLECDRGLGQGEGPLPVHLASVQAGEGADLLPGLPLRAGEQHSFVLHPYMSSLGGGSAPTATPAPPPPPKVVPDSGSLKWMLPARQEEAAEASLPPWTAGVEQWEYSVVISCRCSHSESSLHYRHKLTWRPSPPRDLLLSVTLEGAAPSASGPHFIPQTVVVRASNLTDHEMALTLLAPTSLAASALSRMSFPGTELAGRQAAGAGSPSASPSPPAPPPPPMRRSSLAPRRGSGGAGEEVGAGGEKKAMMRSSTTRPTRDYGSRPSPASPQLSRMNSMQPLQQMDSLLGISTGETPRPQPPALTEKRSSGGEGGQRTHLWLQSVVPIGRVPARGTAEVRCELLPLSEGIITLDTLHVATKRRDVLYIPEKPLQVFSARRGCADRVTSSSASAAYADFGVHVQKEGERKE